MNKIILVGYMGSGKSTVGKILAEKLKLAFFDLDELIENTAGCSIKDLFNTKGEVYFRKLEHEVFNTFMRNNDSYVLSLGGGTPCYANNHLRLQDADVQSVYLRTSIPEIVRRLAGAKSKRPLIADKNNEELTEYVAKHLFDRSYFYHFAKLHYSTDGKNNFMVADELVGLLT